MWNSELFNLYYSVILAAFLEKLNWVGLIWCVA